MQLFALVLRQREHKLLPALSLFLLQLDILILLDLRDSTEAAVTLVPNLHEAQSVLI